jgi:hypothetical protein
MIIAQFWLVAVTEQNDDDVDDDSTCLPTGFTSSTASAGLNVANLLAFPSRGLRLR